MRITVSICNIYLYFFVRIYLFTCVVVAITILFLLTGMHSSYWLTKYLECSLWSQYFTISCLMNQGCPYQTVFSYRLRIIDRYWFIYYWHCVLIACSSLTYHTWLTTLIRSFCCKNGIRVISWKLVLKFLTCKWLLKYP